MTNIDRRDVVVLGISSLATMIPAGAPVYAQSAYPERPLRLIVPFSAGGVVDVIGRLWAEQIRPLLHTIVIENLGGAGGTIGAAEVARAQPDGYTLLFGNTSTQVLNPAVMARPPYDAATAFVAVSILANSAVSIGVNPRVPANTLSELISYIKANPDKLSYGSPGTGTFTHLAGEMFKQMAGTPDLGHIPYKGAGPGISDLISGHIPIMVMNVTNQGIELHKTGKIRILAVLTPKRLAALPNVATGTETLPNLIAMLFTGLFMPAGTPKPIVDRVAQANHSVMANEAFQKRLVEMGFEPVLDTPAEAQRFIDAERSRLLPLVKSIGFTLG
jgi:tripartite-type tricarboxylate transporter receptor subunit TctC